MTFCPVIVSRFYSQSPLTLNLQIKQVIFYQLIFKHATFRTFYKGYAGLFENLISSLNRQMRRRVYSTGVQSVVSLFCKLRCPFALEHVACVCLYLECTEKSVTTSQDLNSIIYLHTFIRFVIQHLQHVFVEMFYSSCKLLFIAHYGLYVSV